MPMVEFKILENIPQATIVHHVESDGMVWATGGRKILRKMGRGWEEISKFPFAFPRDLFACSRPTARAFRADKCNLYRNRYGGLLGIRAGCVYRIESDGAHKLFKINGDCVLHGSLCEDEQGNIYFGEYFMNPKRQPAFIWQVSYDLHAWHSAAKLEGIRHIHGIYPDPYNIGTFWVTVGDYNGECFFLKTTDDFRTFEKLGDGSQAWRAVRLFFTQDHICWLTDSNIEQNTACRMNRKNGRLEIGQTLDASAWYGCQTSEGCYLAFTTIERGPAIQTNTSSVLFSQDAFHWQKIYGFKKDSWKPIKLFKYGVIICPSGEMSVQELYLSGEGLIGLDGISIKASISFF